MWRAVVAGLGLLAAVGAGVGGVGRFAGGDSAGPVVVAVGSGGPCPEAMCGLNHSQVLL